MVEKNKKSLFTLENEAMDFVWHTFKTYKNKVDYFTVAFSGGKDSQVTLDIVSRVLPPDEYITIFTDTTMELPPTYDVVKRTKEKYTTLYPELKFYTARHEEKAIKLWKKIGPPSRINRWCCSVYKTAPFARFIKKIDGNKRQPKILVFEGVRNDESARRSNYKRILQKTKHISQINASVIQNWNAAEVFLYTFFRSLNINTLYRLGLTRIGCSICPFSSSWSEFIITRKFPQITSSYWKILQDYAVLLGVKDTKEYIKDGQWKKRVGGEGIDTSGTRVDFIEKNNDLQAVLVKPHEDLLEWLKVAGDVLYKDNENKVDGEIQIGKDVFAFEVEKKGDNMQLLKAEGIGKDVISKSKIKKVLYKSTYCVHCGVCEAECPTGALTVIPKVTVDTKLCIHCSNCINFVDRGCLAAKSLMMKGGNKYKMNNRLSGFNRYLTFGIRRNWLINYLRNIDSWFSNNNLGPIQVESMIVWLSDAGLLERKTKKHTYQAEILASILNDNEKLVWEIIWINLFYNSSVVNWYLTDVLWGEKLSVKELKERVNNDSISERSISNGINSLVNMFSSSPIGDTLRLGILTKKGRERFIYKAGSDNIHPAAVAYSLYKYMENKKRHDFTVSEFYEDNCSGGPYKLFGIQNEKFRDDLRYLQENKNRLLKVDLTADLDNIHLRNDINSTKILEILLNWNYE